MIDLDQIKSGELMIPQEPKRSNVQMRTQQFETLRGRSSRRDGRPKSWQLLQGSGKVRSRIQELNL